MVKKDYLMISLIKFSYEKNKKDINYHFCFKTENSNFVEKFRRERDYLVLRINSSGVLCELKIPPRFWDAFCNNKMYNTIYIEKDCLYINLFDKNYYKQVSKNDLQKYVVIHRSILNNSCKVVLYLKISNVLFVRNKISNPIKSTKNNGVTALVISDNRKCTYNAHELQDVSLIVRIACKNGDIKDVHILASYCENCDEYFILKSDYYKLKSQGAILCPIEDRTVKQKGTQKYENAGSESRIHQLGYNVKKESKFTPKQRQIILANIIENTGITKAEIKSNIIRCINQHRKHKGYENAIACWKDDLEFINNYHNGDIPEIKVDKLILKYKQDS